MTIIDNKKTVSKTSLHRFVRRSNERNMPSAKIKGFETNPISCNRFYDIKIQGIFENLSLHIGAPPGISPQYMYYKTMSDSVIVTRPGEKEARPAAEALDIFIENVKFGLTFYRNASVWNYMGRTTI